MTYEKTTELNPYRLTIKQHFHLKAVLKNFEREEGIKVTQIADGAVSYHDADDEIFLGLRSWSQEAEADISHPIEERFFRGVERVVRKGLEIVNHEAISRYHLLWTLRHDYAKNPIQEQAIFPAGLGDSLPQDVEEWAESQRKVPIRQGGMIAGRFIATKHLEQDLVHPDNTTPYQGIFWNVLHSDGKDLISADCYGGSLLMVLSPRYALKGERQPQKISLLSAEEAEQLNEESARRAHVFTIG
ncbi:TPA: hypothetical protein ACKRQV_000036 [Pseudomonas aeruginosa]|nr:hypothetical protein [Pseudomonas aeruginosa]EIU2863544.1 hypothetical protein [Pseudomonas aeruginosa]HEK3717310.1 hypothetical protein [Pseudomonas aeruginosa]